MSYQGHDKTWRGVNARDGLTEASLKGSTLCEPRHWAFEKRDNRATVERRVVASGLQGRQSTEDIRGRETALRGVIMEDTCHHTLVRTRGVYSPRSDPNAPRTPGDDDVPV